LAIAGGEGLEVFVRFEVLAEESGAITPLGIGMSILKTGKMLFSKSSTTRDDLNPGST
jgi:hypothetical protein